MNLKIRMYEKRTEFRRFIFTGRCFEAHPGNFFSPRPRHVLHFNKKAIQPFDYFSSSSSFLWFNRAWPLALLDPPLLHTKLINSCLHRATHHLPVNFRFFVPNCNKSDVAIRNELRVAFARYLRRIETNDCGRVHKIEQTASSRKLLRLWQKNFLQDWD